MNIHKCFICDELIEDKTKKKYPDTEICIDWYNNYILNELSALKKKRLMKTKYWLVDFYNGATWCYGGKKYTEEEAELQYRDYMKRYGKARLTQYLVTTEKKRIK
jgi:hypothetical protein